MRNLLEGVFAGPIWPVNPKHFVLRGNSADMDFGDVLDYLGSDPGTRAILMCSESVQAARKLQRCDAPEQAVGAFLQLADFHRNHALLSEPRGKALLAAYGIPVVETHMGG
jgi:acyl-CoA synthetase (NDP forming)